VFLTKITTPRRLYRPFRRPILRVYIRKLPSVFRNVRIKRFYLNIPTFPPDFVHETTVGKRPGYIYSNRKPTRNACPKIRSESLFFDNVTATRAKIPPTRFFFQIRSNRRERTFAANHLNGSDRLNGDDARQRPVLRYKYEYPNIRNPIERKK